MFHLFTYAWYILVFSLNSAALVWAFKHMIFFFDYRSCLWLNPLLGGPRDFESRLSSFLAFNEPTSNYKAVVLSIPIPKVEVPMSVRSSFLPFWSFWSSSVTPNKGSLQGVIRRSHLNPGFLRAITPRSLLFPYHLIDKAHGLGQTWLK